MEVFEVRRSAVVGAVLALTILLVPVNAQYVLAPRAQETYGPERAPASEDRDFSNDVPAHISVVRGSVTLERDGKLEPAEANVPLLAGDRLRTRGGRVEILYADGSALTVDENTELDFLSDSLLRLLDGQLRFAITRATTELDYRVDAPSASVWIRAAGDYRIKSRRDTQKPEVSLTVIRGSAELVNQHGQTLVRAGYESITTPDLAPSLAYAVNTAEVTDFDQWTEDLRHDRVGATSVNYLPSELRYESGTFEDTGSWDYVQPYGAVWYPRVAANWRPYYQGRWSYSGHFGWSWIGIDRWSWATHHYGSWGHSNIGWYWIPGRRWGPAWVAWGNAPGYVSWCPTGWDGYPVIGFHGGGGYYGAYGWTAWTIVPRSVFVPNLWVTQHVVVHNTIAPTVLNQFVVGRTAPIVPTIRVRNIEPLRAPTFSRGTAIARSSLPVDSGVEGFSTDQSWRERSVGSATARAARAVPPAGTARSSGSTTRSSSDRADAGAGAVAVPAFSRASGARDTGTVSAVTADRATTDRSRTGSASPRADMPVVQAPRVEVPQASTVDQPSRAIPRATSAAPEERQVNPYRAPERAAPASGTQSGSDDRASRAGSRVPRAEPSQGSSSNSSEQRQEAEPDRSRLSRPAEPARQAPPSQAEPDRSRFSRPAEPSRAAEPSRTAPPPQAEPDRAPSRFQPSGPPQSSAPPSQSSAPPSQSQAPSRQAGPPSNSSAPPPPPSARGRGGDGGGDGSSAASAAPRARGGGQP